MAWSSYADGRQAGWNVNPDGVGQILCARAFSHYKRTHARWVEHHRRSGPDWYQVDINMDGSRGAVHGEAVRAYQQFWQLFQRDGQQAYRFLVDARLYAVQDENYVQRMLRDASHRSMVSIDRSVRLAQTVVQVAWDLPASVLIVGSTFVTGPAALLALAGGSVWKGVGTYEDTGDVGVAAVQTVTSFVFGLVPVAPGLARAAGETLSGTEQTMVFLLGTGGDALTNTTVAVASHHDLRASLYGSLASAGLGALTGQLGDDFAEGLALPATVVARGVGATAANVAGNAVTGALERPPPQHLPLIRGSLNAAAAAPAGNPVRSFAQSYVQLRAMSPVLSLQPMSGQEFLHAIRHVQ